MHISNCTKPWKILKFISTLLFVKLKTAKEDLGQWVCLGSLTIFKNPYFKSSGI